MTRSGTYITGAPERRLPMGLKIAYTLFMVILVPVYWVTYGPSNFIYFCDIALFVTLAALWLENATLAGMATVGILLPQLLWCADFLTQFVGLKITGMTDYMFDAKKSLFSRSLSFFHGWLPFLLLYLMAKLGYKRRSLPLWTVTAWAAMLISYLFLPAPGAPLANPNAPVNINYVYGLSDTVAQTWMPQWAWLTLLFIGLPLVIYMPTHFLLVKFYGRTEN